MATSEKIHDLLIIGGGINGAGIAADAAGRGLDVLLCEKTDLAGATSSWSTKLIHGGLRYLEFYEFSLVRKALMEREVLTRAAPHIIKPLAFQIPQLNNSRGALMLRAGLFLYDNLARREIYKGSRAVKYDASGPLNPSIKSGFEYWDAQVDDSRLVLLNAMQARKHGADIRTRCAFVGATADAEGWLVELRNEQDGSLASVRSRAIVNASGPWVSKLLATFADADQVKPIKLVKGSHILVPRVSEDDHAYMLQHHDGRIVFVIPYLDKYSLIGTTEEDYDDDLDKISISEAETDYLLSITNLYFKKATHRSDIVASYSGVRPLVEEEGKSSTRTSRDYRLDLSAEPQPLLSVYGGKVTTYRVLAESVLDKLRDALPGMGQPWTKTATLPGGDFDSVESLADLWAQCWPWLPTEITRRWLQSYGTLALDIVDGAASIEDMGIHFGAGLYQREVDYLRKQEWALSAGDILWRRSKLGYAFTEEQTQALEKYLHYSNNNPIQ